MGFEIDSCYRCKKVLPPADFQVGEAFRVGTIASCTNCLKALLAKLTPEQRYKVLADQDAITAAKKEEDEDAATETSPPPRRKPPSTIRKRSPFSTTTSLRTLQKPPAVPTAKSFPIPVVAGAAAGAIVLILLLIGLAGGSSTPAPVAKPTPAKAHAPAPAKTPPPPAKPPDAGRAREEERLAKALGNEIASLEKDIRQLADAKTMQKALDRLAESRSRHAAPDWTRAIARLEKEIADAAAGNFLRIKPKALEARRAGKEEEVETWRQEVATWGISSYISDLDQALAAVPPPPPVPGIEVKSLTLLDDKGKPIRGFDPLEDNAEIDLSEMPSRRFEIRANTSGGVSSVVFGYNGNARFKVESGSPYEIAGGHKDFPLPPGSHTIVATPYAEDGGNGKAGRPLTIRLRVVE